ncbi:helix-turn-helix domain-containing protein [Actinosynnema sp. NPDC059335]|uniref:helix-turn-helix domain-containing protein n=1 Tax=Actinosynnema sp. NPDC059335 TaxID=3346804 RepID=UPI00366F94EE
MSEGGRPDTARDAAGFVAMLRELKERSGLTLRGLEERAAARGEVLARSTVADMLRKDALPRPELLAAYVRACGVEHPEPWLRARERLAVGLVDPSAPPPPPPRLCRLCRLWSRPPPRPWRRRWIRSRHRPAGRLRRRPRRRGEGRPRCRPRH